MTKEDEIKMLDRFIARLGRDSYLGPWLAEHRDELVHDITSDLPPRAPMLAEAIREAAALIEEAKAKAGAIRAEAERRQQLLLDEAREHAARVRRTAREHLLRFASEL